MHVQAYLQLLIYFIVGEMKEYKKLISPRFYIFIASLNYLLVIIGIQQKIVVDETDKSWTIEWFVFLQNSCTVLTKWMLFWSKFISRKVDFHWSKFYFLKEESGFVKQMYD